MNTVTIFAMLMCTPTHYCVFNDDGSGTGRLKSYPTADICQAAAERQTRNYENAGSHGYYGECVSKQVPAWAPVD